MKLKDISLLLQTARDLTEPGEVNAEYVRGQVNLICEVSGVPFAMDVIGDLITFYITYRSSELTDVLLAIAMARETD